MGCVTVGVNERGSAVGEARLALADEPHTIPRADADRARPLLAHSLGSEAQLTMSPPNCRLATRAWVAATLARSEAFSPRRARGAVLATAHLWRRVEGSAATPAM